jgi:alkanesulfonate monooxygenase SsuD/methylene tetrahydromethanopterin reductase-like flavin-dependent oxidoreductase (luciferase family)
MEFGIFDHVDRSELQLADYYEARLNLVEVYDRCGFYGYHVAEHHSTPLGLAASPSVYLSAVAQRTQKLRFGPLVYLLPFYHPLRLIEEICLLDQMSRGRFQVGIGRGISPFESAFYGVSPDESRERFDEALEILMKGLTEKSLTHVGRWHQFNDVPMEVQPLQRPYPPLWMGVNTAASATTAAKRGANIVSLLSPSEMHPLTEAYWNAASPNDQRTLKAGLSLFVVVDNDSSAATSRAEEAYAAWYKSFNHLYRLHGRGPVLGERPESFAALEKVERGISGTPDRVAEFMLEAIKKSGVNYILCQFAFGSLGADVAINSAQLFAERVMPKLRSKQIS